MRLGLHSGVAKTDIERNNTAGRSGCGGEPLALAKGVGDAGQGGMVILSQACFQRLQHHQASSGASKLWGANGNKPLLLCMGEHQLKDESLGGRVTLYQAISADLISRLAFFGPLRTFGCSGELGVLDAPLGHVTVVFASLVGVSTLLILDKVRLVPFS